MASEPRTGKTPAPYAARNVYGPRPISALIPAVARPAYKKRSPATATLLLEWEAIVGPALAAVTTPRRLTADSLAIGCAGPVAMELQHLAPLLIERINAHFGRVLVQRLRFLQDGLVPLAAPPPPRKTPSKEMIEAADRAVADLPPGELRDALAALGRAILTERGLPSTRPDEKV